FDDARVRQAVAYAIDRNALVDVVLAHQVPRLDSTLLPYQSPYYQPSFDRYRRDQTLVATRMHAAGWQRGKGGWWRSPDHRTAKIVLTTPSGNPLRLKAVQLIGAQLRAAGFRSEILLVKPEVFFGSVVARGAYDLALYSFTQGTDPSQSKVFACSQIARAPTWAGKNNAKYCRHDLDRLLARGDRELDITRRADLVRDVGELLATDLPALPLYEQPDTLAWNRRLHGVKPNAMGGHLWNIDDWWLSS
ncbi:MAG: extracellular solute-binding protein family 5, partial [Thermoleophilia bacterium]|nr:extracellular solute-binding protein family 5 [Thermoleophilia bacterium]